ncbi:MAG: hypothetical protein H6878_02605 [Rhodobiaceae bacterium]|nr:hypothetical protein [Rhodobiaceae bacterium]MCC0040757.1 hypothetical protein [Rhodobiaceae bacterium]
MLDKPRPARRQAHTIRTRHPGAAFRCVAVLCGALAATGATAGDTMTMNAMFPASGAGKPMMMQPPPAGVMGAHLTPRGKTMVMYSSRWMHGEGLLMGTQEVSPEYVALNIANVNAPPATVRMVPLSMNMNMQMLGLSHGLTQRLSISAATSYVFKEMETLTFAGMSGDTRLGTKTNSTEGLGDSRIAATFQLYRNRSSALNAGLGLSLPTGSITERINPLMPNGSIGDVRAMYGLQLGTGTVDLLPNLTYLGNRGKFGYGIAYRGRIALQDENSEGYRWGDRHAVTAWLSYALSPALSGTARVEASTEDAIHGADPNIDGAGRGSNPAFYGGERIELFAGFNLRGKAPGGHMARLAGEIGMPVYENLNGVQLSRDWVAQLTGSLRF